MNSLLRTHIKHERTEGLDAVRGSRFWSQAEVTSNRFFLVEGCTPTGQDDKREVRSFITTDFLDAIQVCRHNAFEWVHVHMYARAPTLFPSGHVFQTISEAFSLGPESGFLFNFASGLALVDGKVGPSRSGALSLGRQVFPLGPR